jgi:hypothetical protein
MQPNRTYKAAIVRRPSGQDIFKLRIRLGYVGRMNRSSNEPPGIRLFTGRDGGVITVDPEQVDAGDLRRVLKQEFEQIVDVISATVDGKRP